MQTEINEIIAKNMPQAVGDELRKRLEQADRDAILLKTAVANQEAQRVEIASLKEQLSAHATKLSLHDDLATREAEVAARERGAENQALRIELEAHKGNAQFARDVALGLVRNTEFRNSVHESHNGRAMPVAQGGTVMHAYNTESSSRTDTQQAV